MIIVGYGYADCLLGGAIVALKEKEERTVHICKDRSGSGKNRRNST